MPRGGHIPGSGRKKGVPNKKTQEAFEIAQRLNVDPFEVLLLYAKRDWKALGYKSELNVRFVNDTVIEEPVISPELSATSAAKACEYLYPKRKAIEHKVEGDQFTEITRTILTRAVENQP